MTPLLRAAALGYGVMLAWHLATAALAAALGLSVRQASNAELGFPLIFFFAGFLGTRGPGWPLKGVVAALAAGLAHGTIGWQISAAIRGGHLPGGADHVNARREFLVEWLWEAFIIGMLGAAVSRVRVPRHPPSTSEPPS